MDYISLYTDFLAKHAEIKKPLSVVCDASNGAAGHILKKLLPELGLREFTLINDTPDPEFPAHGPNPLLPGSRDQLVAAVKEKGADIGAIFDADGDRVFFVDEKGNELYSFVIAALLFKHSTPPFVADELVFQALRHMNIVRQTDLHPSRVGVFFIKEKMRETGASAAAEFSGHFYFKDFFGADSGIFALIRVLSILSSLPETLSGFASNLPKHIVRNEDIRISGKSWKDIEDKIVSAYAAQGAVIEHRDGVTFETPQGWVNIRPSNTEPIVRIYVGSSTEPESKKLLLEATSLV